MNTSSKSPNEYRLLYFSPRPEDGEQVCVGILENVGGRWSLDFDEKLSKIQAISRDQDRQFVLNTLEAIRSDLNTENLSSLIRGVEPQFRISEPRKLLVGWSEETRRLLRKRFLRRETHTTIAQEPGQQRELDKKLRDLVRTLRPDADSYLISDATPVQIFRTEAVAKQLKNPKPVANAIVGRNRTVLIDGVDTNIGMPAEVISRANRIAFTFWQYGRLAHERASHLDKPRQLFRVGVVFDGNPKGALLRDYSLHQFTNDADVAIEADQQPDLGRVRDEIEKTIADIHL